VAGSSEPIRTVSVKRFLDESVKRLPSATVGPAGNSRSFERATDLHSHSRRRLGRRLCDQEVRVRRNHCTGERIRFAENRSLYAEGGSGDPMQRMPRKVSDGNGARNEPAGDNRLLIEGPVLSRLPFRPTAD
jgi:hypothetical protein